MIIQDFPQRRSMIPNCRGCYPGLGIFPITFSVLTSLTFIVTYMISVALDHVYKYFPTISDTGGQKPESNIFGLLLSLSSFIGFIVVLLRYIQYQHLSEYNEEDHSRLILVNKVAFVIGIIACFGALIVANFQDRGKSAGGHAAGALAVFGGGTIYGWFQTYLTYKMLQCAMNARKLCLYRLILSLLGSAFFILFLILFYFATKQFNDHKIQHDYSHWHPDDPGYALHVSSSVAEWLCAASLLLFFLSFTGEFNKIKMGFNVQRRNDVNTLPFQNSTDDRQPLVYT